MVLVTGTPAVCTSSRTDQLPTPPVLSAELVRVPAGDHCGEDTAYGTSVLVCRPEMATRMIGRCVCRVWRTPYVQLLCRRFAWLLIPSQVTHGRRCAT